MPDHPTAVALSPAILAILAGAPVTDTWAGSLSTAQQTALAQSGPTASRPHPPPVLLAAYGQEITFDSSHGSHRSHASHSSHSSHYSSKGGTYTPPPTTAPVVQPPPTTTPAAAKPAVPPAVVPTQQPMWQSLQSIAELSAFCRCCEAADLAKTLLDPSKTFTVFAFTDAAFAAATADSPEVAEPPKKPALAKLAAANITEAGKLLQDSLTPGLEVRMLNYETVLVSALSSGVLMRGRKSVRTIVVDRGVIYVFNDLVYAP